MSSPEYIGKYVELLEFKKTIGAQYKQKLKDVDNALTKIKPHLQQWLQQQPDKLLIAQKVTNRPLQYVHGLRIRRREKD
jgi:hypothetical protein